MVNTEVRKIFLAVFSIFGTVIFLLAMSCNAFADDITPVTASSKFSVDVNNAVLELTLLSTPAVIDLNPTMTGASFGSTSIDIKVATNNITGYTLTMTPTNLQTDTSLIRTELIGDEEEYREIETLEQTDPISTGYTKESFTTNKWGYKITGDNYYGINPNNTTVSHPAWVTDAPTNETHHNLTLAAKVDAETTAGSYETTLIFRVVTNATIARDIITFDANGGTGSMDGISVPAGDTITLPQNTFTAPEGHRFTGWYAVQADNNKNIGVYGDNAPYTATDIGYNRHITLYAQWTNLPGCTDNCDPAPDPTTGAVGTTFQRAYEIAYTAMHKGMYEQVAPDSTHYEEVKSWGTPAEQYKNLDVRFAMQDMTPEICASVTVMHDDYRALDIRDDKLYHITKTDDGSCWMTQNLDLDLVHETNDTNARYTHYNTDLGYTNNDVSAKWNPTYNSYVLEIDGGIPRDVYSSGTYTPASLNPGDAYIVPNYEGSVDTIYKSLAECINGTQMSAEAYCSHYHVGNYYNWTAAIAENNSEPESISVPWAYAPNSVCPAGWRLPRGATSSSPTRETADEINISMYKSGFMDMERYFIGNWSISQDLYGKFRSDPFYTVRSGYYSLDYFENLGSTVMSWTGSTNWGSGIGSAFEIGVGRYTGPQIYISQFDSKSRPMTVRCLAR